MAVTITRSVWIDDDGTGTTGTVINQALHTTLYNEIDTALAKVPQLAGGNTFTGAQTLGMLRVLATGEVMVNINGLGNTVFGVAADGVARAIAGLQNTNPTASAYMLIFYNNTGALAGSINQTNATTVAYNTTSDARLKDDEGAAHDLDGLRGVVVHDFRWRADGVRDRGVFAQEAHARYPRAVTPGTDETTDDGSLARPWMTDYSKFVPDLIVGWQQHDAALAELRAILATAGVSR